MRNILLIIGVLLLSASVLGAQEKVTKADSTQQSVQSKQEEKRPVAVPVMSEKAVRHYRSGTVLWPVNILLGLLIPALFLFTGFSARIRDWAQSLGRKWFFLIAIYFVVFTILNFLIYFPLSYYQDFVHQHAYDLSNQTFSKWFSDSLKGLIEKIEALMKEQSEVKR